MKHSKKILALLSTLPLFLLGCNSSTDSGLTGDIIGYANLADLNGALVSDSGVTIAIEGTSIKTTSAKDGRWVLSSVPTGTYSIVFSDSGYGTFKRNGFQVVGSGQVFYNFQAQNPWMVTPQSIYKIPNFTIANFLASTTSTGINLGGSFAGTLPSGTHYLRFFVGTTPDVSSDPSKYSLSVPTGGSSSSTSFSTTISSATLGATGVGITSGQTVYIVAYAEGSWPNSYVDFATGRDYYPDLNPNHSIVLTVVVP